jgi:hypothetical protein
MTPHDQEIIDTLRQQIFTIRSEIDELQGCQDCDSAATKARIEALQDKWLTVEEKRKAAHRAADSSLEESEEKLTENSALIEACEEELEQLPQGTEARSRMEEKLEAAKHAQWLWMERRAYRLQQAGKKRREEWKEIVMGLLTLAVLGALIYYASALYVGYFFLGLAALITIVFFHELFTCKGGGCVNGLMLLPAIILAVLGVVLTTIGLS